MTDKFNMTGSNIPTEFKDVPHKYLETIAQLIAGDVNDTIGFDEINEPILKPSIKAVYPLFIIQYGILALIGMALNIALIANVMYYKMHKDVTQAFIVNLALCHFVQCAIVLPISLMVMLIQNWIFGQFLCFFLPLMQDIPLHVAMISHILIGWDRMRWLGDPLKSRLPAFVCCCATWLTGTVVALPYPIYTTYLELSVSFDGTRCVCHACWQRIGSTANRVQPQDAPALNLSSSIQVAGFGRAANTSRRCIFDDCNNFNLRVVPNSIKAHLLSYYNLYIPELARVCQNHLISTTWEDFAANVTRRQNDFNSDSFRDMVRIYTTALENKTQIDFENFLEIDQDLLHFWTGLRHEQFNRVLEETPSLLQRTKLYKTALGVYLCKIRTGEPNDRLAASFCLSRRSLERMLKIVRECLTNDFIPRHLGVNHISRNEVIRRNRRLPNHIFGTTDWAKAIAICDGSYLSIQKSSNFLFQKKSYSLHKFKNLVKPFIIVCGDGYIIDITGPYAAQTSDATIMKGILENKDGPLEDGAFHWLFEEGDCFIVDRGFRDVVGDLESYGYVPHMPPSKGRGEQQLSTEAANKSRLVTICRWVIEAVNGKFKRDFKIFRHMYFNRASRNIMVDFKIAAALINSFQQPYDDSEYTESFIQIIDENVNRSNHLGEYIEENNINRQRATFRLMDANNPTFNDFPRLTTEDMILFAIGTYHLKISRSYCWEHIRRSGVYIIQLYRHPERITTNNVVSGVLIRARIQSRHVRTKTYYTYIMYNSAESGSNAIIDYYCSCIHGRRTLGSCSHVMSVIYYLGHARHVGIEQPAALMDSVIVDIDD